MRSGRAIDAAHIDSFSLAITIAGQKNGNGNAKTCNGVMVERITRRSVTFADFAPRRFNRAFVERTNGVIDATPTAATKSAESASVDETVPQNSYKLLRTRRRNVRQIMRFNLNSNLRFRPLGTRDVIDSASIRQPVADRAVARLRLD